ncbi:hypothetical protein HU750_12695 [Pseudomonas sp. SWRI50]|uniref:hypothetical protein n=1 Tax=Pseudomonas sp. SWRI50 TaxID=2745484 RepID=UPI0016445A23|nr:hypothetical protein [Pseudomonas sp. SWRI50]MBC3486528.1 hypothetical protein [Pseudomonas sp. SWRI50]
MFELEDYSKKPETTEPAWVKNETTRKLFKHVTEEFNSLKAQIMSQQATSAPKIVPRRVALANSVDPSLITKRRQPDVLSLISDYNMVNRPWFTRHSPSSENSVSHTLLATAA